MAAFHSERSWLREASLQRLNTMLINKRELPEHASVLRDDICLKDIDSSGLSITECYHITQWATGQESGRHCMLALLEHRRIQNHTKTAAEMEQQLPDGNGGEGGSSEESSVAFGLIGRTINLPAQVFADSGELHEKLFHKSPNAVLKDTLKTLASVAMEKGALSLNAEQLNLALKQLRVQTIGAEEELTAAAGANLKQAAESNDTEPADENVENSSNDNISSKNVSDKILKKTKKSHSMEAYRLQIVQELIRVYVKQLGVGRGGRGGESADDFHSADEQDSENHEPSLFTGDDSDLLRHHHTLEKHLAVSLERVAEHSEKEPMEDIERENTILLSYIRQITAMKGSLETQLKDFESSRAFLSLGLSKNATTEQIRKAYHAKAIKLHPDKKGGSTEKFQKLQIQYQDIVKQRELEDSCREKKFPDAEEHARRAQELVADMELHLRDIKAATETCGTLGQLNMRWVKKLESFADMLFPKNITKMMKYILKHLESAGDTSSLTESDVLQTDLSVQSCSAKFLVKPMNIICEKLQKLLASGVGLVSLGRYGRAASNKKSYLQLLEQAVACGLSVSEHIKDIDNVESQVISCVERFLDVQGTLLMAKEKLVSFTTANVLIEMALTVFRSRSITVNMIAEIAVLATVLGGDICAQAQELVEKVDIEVRDEIRKASHDAATEMENDYCEEDIANLAKVKEQRMKEEREEDALRCKAQEQRREEERKQEEQAEDVMDHLNSKIRQLHVQLKLQYVQTLQKINTDACQYQKKLLKPLLCEFGAVSDQQEPTLVKESVLSERRSYNGAEEKDRVRVLTLLADFMDRSCLKFRDSLVAQREADALHQVRAEVGVSDEGYRKLTFWDLLNNHLGWMTALDRSQQTTEDNDEAKKDVESSSDAAGTPEDIEQETKEDIARKSTVYAPVKKKLVFFPDYRSRVMYLSVLLDPETVNNIVENELQPRLGEILLPANIGRQPEQRRSEIERDVAVTASLFCALVSQGVNTARSDIYSCA